MVDKNILIDLVRERVALWDQREKQYHNRDLRTKLWEEVGKELKIEGDEARKQWELLRDMFRKKIKESKGVSGSAAKPKWMYFDALSFLIPMIKSRITTGNLSVLVPPSSQQLEEHCEANSENDINSIENYEHESEEVTERENDRQPQNPPTVSNNPQGSKYQRPGSKRKQAPSIQEEALELERRKVHLMEARFATPLTNDSSEDDDLSFFKSLVPSLKKLSDIRRMKPRAKILNCVIAELEAAQETERAWPLIPETIQPPRCPSGSAYYANHYGPASDTSTLTSPSSLTDL